MKKITQRSFIKLFRPALRRGAVLFGLAIPLQIFSQITYTFTNAGATGQNGPTQAQINTAYASTNLAGLVTSNAGIQNFTVPSTGAYQIEAYGAQGGANWGMGAKMVGEFNLTAGQVLRIVVGQSGGSANSIHGSGGGGSFVVDATNTPLIVAGGGGGKGAGSGSVQSPSYGSTLTAGGSPAGGGPGGTSGGGGAAASGATGGNATTPGANASGSYWASGGGGLLTNGGMYSSGSLNGGRAFMNGATGGDATAVNYGDAPGGFGGGGGAGDRGAGGGGYSGGGGGTNNNDGGGGGGSINNGTNQLNVPNFQTGHGLVKVTSLCNVTLNGATSICTGQSTTLTSTAASNVSWSTGSNQQSIIVTPQVSTAYTVTGNGTINNCASVIIFTVTVHPLPTVSALVSPGLLCVGATATLLGQGASTYTWSSGPSGTMTTVSPAVTTNYTVTGTSSVGCVSSAVFPVTVNALELTISGSTVVCMGKSTALTGSGGTSLSWVNSGPFPTINVSPTVATTYTLTGIDANNCPLTKEVSVVVNPNPVVTASASKTLSCKNNPVTLTAGGASSYVWGSSAGNAVTAVTTVVPPLTITYNYSVTGTDVNGCTGTANVAVKVEACTGINELQSGTGFQLGVYPNPNTGEFVITSDVVMDLIIINELGQTVRTVSHPGAGREITVSDLQSGIYFVSSKDNTTLTKKIVVTR